VDALHGGDVTRILDDTYTCSVSSGGTANITWIFFSQIAADGTETDGSARFANRIGERKRVFFLIVQNMKGKTLCRFFTDPGQFCERIDQFCDRGGVTIGHG
jgi:hypothetical protein